MKQREEFSSFYDSETGLPKDKSYLECGLPEFLQESVQAMKAAWEKYLGLERV